MPAKREGASVFNIPFDTLESFDDVNSHLIPLYLRTEEYDLRLLNGGVNKSAPYTAEQHLATARWQDGQMLHDKITGQEIPTRVLIGMQALRHYGGGNEREVDLGIQKRAVQHLAQRALGHDVVRIIPDSADVRGLPASFQISHHKDGVSALVETQHINRPQIHYDKDTIERQKALFDEVWNSAAQGDERDDIFERTAHILDRPA